MCCDGLAFHGHMVAVLTNTTIRLFLWRNFIGRRHLRRRCLTRLFGILDKNTITHILLWQLQRTSSWARWASHVTNLWLPALSTSVLTTDRCSIRALSLTVRGSFWRVLSRVACDARSESVENLLTLQWDCLLMRKKSRNLSTKTILSIYSVQLGRILTSSSIGLRNTSSVS